MAKKQRKDIKYSEADLIDLFHLTRLKGNNTSALLSEWTNAPAIQLTVNEQETFDKIFKNAYNNIESWNEEELKMKFLCFVVDLGGIVDNEQYKTYYEREIFSHVNGTYLYLKADFMIAIGIMDKPKIPYFYFQEYKKMKDPSGDPVSQLLEGFLIAQQENKNSKPMYGCTVTGKFWDFFVMENTTYCLSDSYDCTKAGELLHIIAMLRKFKEILETRLLI